MRTADRRFVALLLLTIVLAPGVRLSADEESGEEKQEDERQLTPGKAADAVLAALGGSTRSALEKVAAKDKPDPWLVADTLCSRGEYDAAAEFAAAVPRPAVEKLPAYVARRRESEPDMSLRTVLAEMSKARRGGDGEAVLRLARGAREPPDTVTGVQIRWNRAEALVTLRRYAESRDAFLAAAAAARCCGWHAAAASCDDRAGQAAFEVADWECVRAAWARALETYERLGNRAGVAPILCTLGLLHQRFGEYRQSVEVLTRGIELFTALRDDRGIAGCVHNLAITHDRLGDYAKARHFHQRALDLSRALGDPVGVARALSGIGSTHYRRSEFVEALALYERALEALGDAEDPVSLAQILGNIASIYLLRGDHARAQPFFARALESSERAGDHRAITNTLIRLGIINDRLGKYGEALKLYGRAFDVSEAIGDRGGMARGLSGISAIHRRRGEYEEALTHQLRVVAEFEALGDRASIAHELGNLGSLRGLLGGYREALGAFRRALDIDEALGNRMGVARGLNRIGVVHRFLGDYREAIECHARALEMFEAIGARPDATSVLSSLGVVYGHRGDSARALAYLTRAFELQTEIGDRVGAAGSMQNIGAVLDSIGDYPRALAAFQRALETSEAVGDRLGAARALNSIGILHERHGEHEKALEFHARALDIKEKVGERVSIANTLTGLASVYAGMGAHAEAIRLYARARETYEQLDRPTSLAVTLNSLGALHQELGHPDEALSLFHRALEALEEVDARGPRVRALAGAAAVRLATGEHGESLRLAREAAEVVGGLVSGLGEQEGAQARDVWTFPFELGAEAALQAGSEKDLVYFLESGRAGGLREALGARQALSGALIPAELRAAEAEARAREARAQTRCAQVRKSGRRSAVREARKALAQARDDLEGVVQRIQREAKAGADVAYPEAAELERIQGWLGGGDALLLFGPAGDLSVAAVVTADGVDVRALGRMADLEALVGSLDLTDTDTDPSARIEALRHQVVGPLGLGVTTKRVFVSPHGALSYVPFSLLLPSREVAYVPSGTTYGVLIEERARRGEQVLALGDPDYGVPFDPQALATVRGGRQLAPLPQTRAEARAVGDQVLLGKEATEGGLVRAVERHGRWRAIHLACHGLIDVERPMFSSLALTPAGGSDGFLTCLEVFRLRLPADLVVLSACETATGRIYRSEGIVGLTRAFMFAGAPRVICSLWKVDDDATRTLMVKFYELWHPKEGQGLCAAAALKEAQAYVASHEKWRHPFYWAAWVLWGLAD